MDGSRQLKPNLVFQVGDFVFLSLRTRSSNLNVLNRERTPRYRLEVRAKVRRRGGDGKRIRMKEPKCVVDVEAGDTFVLRTPGGGGWGDETA